MKDQDAIQMMQRCREEIIALRRQIDRLTPKAEAYDAITAILGMIPRQAQGYGEDMAWRLEKEISEIQHRMAEPAAPEPAPDPAYSTDA